MVKVLALVGTKTGADIWTSCGRNNWDIRGPTLEDGRAIA